MCQPESCCILALVARQLSRVAVWAVAGGGGLSNAAAALRSLAIAVAYCAAMPKPGVSRLASRQRSGSSVCYLVLSNIRRCRTWRDPSR